MNASSAGPESEALKSGCQRARAPRLRASFLALSRCRGRPLRHQSQRCRVFKAFCLWPPTMHARAFPMRGSAVLSVCGGCEAGGARPLQPARPRGRGPQASGLRAHVPLCSLLFAQAVWLGTSALATELKTQPPPTSRPPNRSSDFCRFPHRTSQGWRRPRVSSAGGAAGRGTPGWRGWRPGPRRPGQEKA